MSITINILCVIFLLFFLFSSDNHDLLSVKFYELASNGEQDPEKFLNVEPNAEGSESERGIF